MMIKSDAVLKVNSGQFQRRENRQKLSRGNQGGVGMRGYPGNGSGPLHAGRDL